jgi:hypothetical protein
MAVLAAGKRLKSAVCTTEVMVIATPGGDIDLTCGGAPMAEGATPQAGASIDAGHATGTAIGKRYVSDDGKLEVLCVKAGAGSLAAGGAALKLKDAKKLPKTD